MKKELLPLAHESENEFESLSQNLWLDHFRKTLSWIKSSQSNYSEEDFTKEIAGDF